MGRGPVLGPVGLSVVDLVTVEKREEGKKDIRQREQHVQRA